MMKKLNLMSKVELYYRTRSPHHIIDTYLYQEGYEDIIFTRENEDFVIWKIRSYYDETYYYKETNRISYEEFINLYKDYNFVKVHGRREYLTHRFRLEKNSVFPLNLTNNKGVETMKFETYGVDYYENILTILDANIYFLENCINSLDGVKKEEKYSINKQQNIVILENKDKLISKINKLIKKSIKLEKFIYKHKYFYYKYNKSIIDDYKYDEKERELKNIIQELGEKKLIIKNIIKQQIFNTKQENIVVIVGNKFIYTVLSKIELSQIKINHENRFKNLDRYIDIVNKVFEINYIIKDMLKEYDNELIKFYNFFKELYKQAKINKIIENENIIDFAIKVTEKEIEGGLKDPSQKFNIALYFVIHAFIELKIL